MSTGTILILIPFVIAVTAIITNTTRKDMPFPKRVTVAGWLLMGLAAVIAILNTVQENRRHMATEMREYVALRQVEQAIYTLSLPYIFDSSPVEPVDRFLIVTQYRRMFEMMCRRNPGKMFHSALLDYAIGDELTADYIQRQTTNGIDLLTTVQASYGDVLDVQTSVLISRVSDNSWNAFLARIGTRYASFQHKKRQDIDGRPPHTVCPPGIRSGRTYWADLATYLDRLAALEMRVGLRICKLRQAQHFEDDLPNFIVLYESEPGGGMHSVSRETASKDSCAAISGAT